MKLEDTATVSLWIGVCDCGVTFIEDTSDSVQHVLCSEDRGFHIVWMAWMHVLMPFLR